MEQPNHNPLAPKVAYAVGSAIRGEKVAAQFRKMNKIVITRGSSTHNIQRTTLEGSVFCVVDRPLNYLRDLPEQRQKPGRQI
jgi:hypothetical protein